MADQNKSLIIADSSPLIAFALLNLLPELASLADRILLPAMVVQECTQNLALPGASDIQKAIKHDVLKVTLDINLSQSPELLTISELIDPGEAQAIAIAQAHSGLLLMDDKAGRRCARNLGLQ